MSVARGFGINGRALYSNVAKPTEVNLQFTVSATNTAGLGVTSVKSNGYVNNVFMHTSATPGTNNGLLNPNPANGYAVIQLKQNLNVFLGMRSSIVSATQTSTQIDNSALTVGQLYVISTLGDATLANWQAIGLPLGVTPAVGVAFIATAVGVPGEAGTATSRVMLPLVSGVTSVEVVGVTNLAVNSNIAANAGQFIYLQFLKQTITAGAYTPAGTNSAPALTMNSYTPAGTNNSSTPPIFTGTPAVLTGAVAAPVFTGTAASLTATSASSVVAPANNSIVMLQLYFDGSSVTVDGL